MKTFALGVAITCVSLASALWHVSSQASEQTGSGSANAQAAPTFYKDVLPIFQDHCQSCHRPGEVAPMPLVTYEQTPPMGRCRWRMRSR